MMNSWRVQGLVAAQRQAPGYWRPAGFSGGVRLASLAQVSGQPVARRLDLYQQLLETTLTPDGKPDPARVADLAGKLKSEFGGSAYAQYGSLFVAKVAVDTGKLDDAAAELKAIVDKPANPTLGEIARQRLAQVLAAQNKADEALKLLDGDADKAFLATREELKGDLLVQLGRTDEANAAYEKAKAALSDEAAVGGLQIKLDDLAKGDA
jgi:predicted negative regulator of RcsB-dependent stress response